MATFRVSAHALKISFGELPRFAFDITIKSFVIGYALETIVNLAGGAS